MTAAGTMPAPPKARFEGAAALRLAERLRERLAPCCERVEIAGSLRRGRPTVGDIELLYIPRFDSVRYDLFSLRVINLVDEGPLAELLRGGELAKRPNSRGAETWGERNKLARHVLSGTPLDLFATCEACWHNYLVCRTGPAALNVEIAQRARARGHKWNPYGPGFTRLADQSIVRMASEREVFEFVGLPWREPSERG